MTSVTTPLRNFVVAGSSPVLVARYDTSFLQMGVPHTNTVVLPLARSRANAVFGYGSGMPIFGGLGGLWQTSGKHAAALPSAACEQNSSSFAYTWVSMRAVLLEGQ